ncbi:flagellar basal body P-ring protein FlgI [Lacipirellula parvula]|uniref:Protein with domain similar to flagellar P-ring protein FlgI n=1 Tax=Lacipirellula parvula TaxID=2650471 RepID=A0A5K7X539_9BACT|nr:flagellar basal body P-ring protein FlgI [Lacipirellula parvula]BBO31660.1 protein with domain similar to flagellar P-ring protein FlgI [Lacipirellula parvula]
MSNQNRRSQSISRRAVLKAAALCVVSPLATGCMGPIFRPQSPDAALSTIEDGALDGSQLVSAVAHPYGMNFVKVENVALVTGLAGTGEDPAPSPQRAALLAELNRREIANPNEILSSPNTALVLVRGYLRPGIQAGDRFDIEVRTPSRTDTTSLRGGWLMETQLSEVAVLGGALRNGHDIAVCQGAILVDPSADIENNPALMVQGRVLNGGVATKSRQLGLILDHSHQSIRLSQMTAKAVSDRFHTYVDGRRTGVATPQTDEYIELIIHPRYKDNIGRYMRVVRSIAIRESAQQRLDRLKLLEGQLLDPVTSETAALRLEAIGGAEAIEILKKGSLASDSEVRFYAAEALAYLDVTEAVEPLAKAATDEPAYRVAAFSALGAMEDGASSEALTKLLGVKSAETRYGAFRALSTMAVVDPLVRGESLNGKFRYHRLDVGGPPMIHVTSSHRPEIVLFGPDHQFKLPLVLDAGPRILVNGLKGDKITVSRFGPNNPTEQRIVSANVDEVIRAIIDLGGDYPDVVQMLRKAKETGALPSRYCENALPEVGRTPDRSDSKSDSKEGAHLVASGG